MSRAYGMAVGLCLQHIVSCTHFPRRLTPYFLMHRRFFILICSVLRKIELNERALALRRRPVLLCLRFSMCRGRRSFAKTKGGCLQHLLNQIDM